MDTFPEEFNDREEVDRMLTYIEKEIRKLKTEAREAGHFERGITLALAMLENGEPEEKILLYTGFTSEQLAEIREGRLRGTE